MRDLAHELRFDRFALDLRRGCLRAGAEDIELRPKTFEVLRHLAANAGALVTKQELHEAVWPNVAVSDDSLVQCIRELRQKLGDHEHRLIKTVSRRGYLLDAAPAGPETEGPAGLARRIWNRLPRRRRERLHGLLVAMIAAGWSARQSPGRAGLIAAGLLVCSGVAGGYLLARGTAPAHTGAPPPAAVSAAPAAVGRPTAAFKDCDVCPEMAELPAGEFMMGAPRDEVGYKQAEGPQRRVTIAKAFALGKFEVTVDQFSAFVKETGLAAGSKCQVMVQMEAGNKIWSLPQASFLQPGFEVKGSHPAVCISGHEAQAYAAWLRRRTGKAYRLPTEAEWEYAARAGTTTSFSFGMDETSLCAYARFADLSTPFGWRNACRSEHPAYGPIQVGLLKPNAWGLSDMLGNAWEWVEDCWTPDVRKLPTDGSAFTQSGGCEVGVIRGGAFASSPKHVRSAHRRGSPMARQYNTVGFRVALSLAP
jgi:formylglycine-generating enzyme required for sulfatase activity/DNA-binding winged helix-turn-helix (wHTH) protein